MTTEQDKGQKTSIAKINIFTRSVRSIVSCTLLSSVFAAFSLPATAENRSLSIGNIRNPQIKIDNYYCELHLKKDRQKRKIFLSSISPEMNIDGQNKILTLVREVRSKRGSIETYRAGDLNVKVNFIRTSPENEGASYDATITVSRGKRSKIVSTTGYCGIS